MIWRAFIQEGKAYSRRYCNYFVFGQTANANKIKNDNPADHKKKKKVRQC